MENIPSLLLPRPASAPPPNLTSEPPPQTELLTRVMIDEMEVRAHNALGKENRGHKLPIEDLPIRRPRILLNLRNTLSCPTEEEFPEVENRFCELQHYRQQQFFGLSARQLYLLYSAWRPFVNRQLQFERLHIPTKLSDATTDVNIKGILAAASLSQLVTVTMVMIEEHCNYLKRLYRLVDDLKQDYSSDEGATTQDTGPLFKSSRRIVALVQHHVNNGNEYVELLRQSRWAMVQAQRHSHLLGRFLVKRRRRMMKMRDAVNKRC